MKFQTWYQVWFFGNVCYHDFKNRFHYLQILLESLGKI